VANVTNLVIDNDFVSFISAYSFAECFDWHNVSPPFWLCFSYLS
jgi:hypothetical protein